MKTKLAKDVIVGDNINYFGECFTVTRIEQEHFRRLNMFRKPGKECLSFTANEEVSMYKTFTDTEMLDWMIENDATLTCLDKGLWELSYYVCDEGMQVLDSTSPREAIQTEMNKENNKPTLVDWGQSVGREVRL